MCCGNFNSYTSRVKADLLAAPRHRLTMYKIYLEGDRGLTCFYRPVIVQCDRFGKIYADIPLFKRPPHDQVIMSGGIHVYTTRRSATVFYRAVRREYALDPTLNHIRPRNLRIVPVQVKYCDFIAADSCTSVFRAVYLSRKLRLKYGVEECGTRQLCPPTPL